MSIIHLKSIVLVLSLLTTGILVGQEIKLSPAQDNNLVEQNAAQKSAPQTTNLFK